MLCCLIGELSELSRGIATLHLIARVEQVQEAIAEESLMDFANLINDDTLGVAMPELNTHSIWDVTLWGLQHLMYRRLLDMESPNFSAIESLSVDVTLYRTLEQLIALLDSY